MNTTNSDKSFEKENSSNTLNLSKEKIYSNKKKKKIVLILSIIIILLILIISFLCVYFLYIKKNKTETEKEPEEETETETENGKKNKIKAVYKTTSGEKIKLLNYKNIKKEGYKIILLENNKKLGNLNNIINSEFTPDVNGDISVNIEFKKSVNNLQSLFENIIQLKRIDLTNFDMSNVINMDSMFEGCTSLEDVILTGVNTENLKSMNYLFKNCKNLKEVDLSPINSHNVENMTSLFEGCENINSINISSFPNIENDAFNGINSKVNVISNERISNQLAKLSLNNLNININILIISFVSKSCEIGKNEKCKECSSLFKGNCLSCNEGYYLPIESSNRKICSSCQKEHCKKCIGTSYFILCHECEEGFIL
jgi:surface protein